MAKPEPRFFVGAPCAAGAEFLLDREDGRHAGVVLRLKIGDPVTLVHAAQTYAAQIAAVDGGAVKVRVLEPRLEASGELPVSLNVLQALPKAAKFDRIVDAVTQLGAQRIVPFTCARSYAKLGAGKRERWQRIARSAAEQSRRKAVPHVAESCTWAQALHNYAAGSLTLVAYERAQPHSLAAALASYDARQTLCIAVGPEGGFSDEEIAAARGAGARLVSLGPMILRTEPVAAAPIAALAPRWAWY